MGRKDNAGRSGRSHKTTNDRQKALKESGLIAHPSPLVSAPVGIPLEKRTLIPPDKQSEIEGKNQTQNNQRRTTAHVVLAVNYGKQKYAMEILVRGKLHNQLTG